MRRKQNLLRLSSDLPNLNTRLSQYRIGTFFGEYDRFREDKPSLEFLGQTGSDIDCPVHFEFAGCEINNAGILISTIDLAHRDPVALNRDVVRNPRGWRSTFGGSESGCQNKT